MLGWDACGLRARQARRRRIVRAETWLALMHGRFACGTVHLDGTLTLVVVHWIFGTAEEGSEVGSVDLVVA